MPSRLRPRGKSSHMSARLAFHLPRVDTCGRPSIVFAMPARAQFSASRRRNHNDASPDEAHQGPHQPSPRRSKYLGDGTGDFFVTSPSFCRLLEVNAARSQAIDHVLRAESLEFIVVGESADLDLEREAQAI